ncbi:MAG: AMP-binding protein [Acidimicrobiia bacterium]
MPARETVSPRIGDLAASLGWDRNHLLPHVDFTIPEAMTEIARQIPDRIAIETGDERVTYADVVARANQVANALLDREPDPTTPIALLCGHGVEPIVAICGVLHAGLIGAPTDAREPAERLQRLIDASGAQLVVTAREHVELASGLVGNDKVVVLDEIDPYGTDAPSVEVPDDHPGLVLFTSGSTGIPKGVIGGHRDIVARSVRTGVRDGVRLGERHALTTSFGFTAAEFRIFAVFLNGATLCTYDLRTRGPRELPDWVRREQIAVVSFVPSTLRTLADVIPPGTMGCVRKVGFSAETLYFRDVRIARPLFGPDTVLRNSLGSTEAGSLARYDIPADADSQEGPVPVGTVADDVEVRVVDEDDQPVADGEIGRLVVLRWGRLALGYWNDPELTRRYFFNEPDGRRGFRTPDSGRWRDDGLLEHVGRMDSRVKVHGAMVATSEVEVALISLPDVADAAVIAVPGDDGGTRLVAYVVARRGAALSAWKLRRDLAERLSSTSVPSAFVAVDVLPRTVRDKIDRTALPAPPPTVRPRPYREPTSDGQDLAAIFAGILGVERVGLDDDFFDLGGDSLGVVELLAAIAERFSVDIPASTILEAPTVAKLSLRLSYRRPSDASPVVTLRSDAPGSPFFCVAGAGSPAIGLRGLSRAMSNHNFSAIQARGLEERAIPDHSIRAAARRNIAAMRAAQPTGPYAIGGYSYGGLVAFEMACQLRAARQDVSLLVVLDTSAPISVHSVTNRVRARSTALKAAAPSPPLRRAAVVAVRGARFAVKSAYAHAERRISLTSAGWLPRRGYHQYNLFLRLNARMAHEYKPSGIFDGPALIVRGDIPDGIPAGLELEEKPDPGRRALPDLGWSKLVTGPITVAEVSADHQGLTREPAVNQVAAHIAAAVGSQGEHYG